MARLHGTNILNSTIEGHQHEDGYWLTNEGDGHTILSLSAQTLFKSVLRTNTGLWQATLLEAQPCNLKYFHVDVVHLSSSATFLQFVLLDNTVGTAGATTNVINFGFINPTSGVLTDLAAGSGMQYELGLQLSTAYYIKNY